MKYIEYVNGLLKQQFANANNIVLFGQNISAGSCLSGLSRGIKVPGSSYILNTPNAENTLTGIGFGLMLNGVSSVFFMKQLDFLLLGIDHLVNTYNFVRLEKPEASFTIMPVVVDLGYQGMQSSFNSLGDICSIARIPGYSITNKYDAEKIVDTQLLTPGFRIITVSQRLFNKELLGPEEVLYSDKDCGLFQYTKGKDATIVCFNFSFPQGLELQKRLSQAGLKASLFSVNLSNIINWGRIIDDMQVSRNLIVFDDSKSETLACDNLLSSIPEHCWLEKKIVFKRTFSNKWFYPNPDEMEIDYDRIVSELDA